MENEIMENVVDNSMVDEVTEVAEAACSETFSNALVGGIAGGAVSVACIGALALLDTFVLKPLFKKAKRAWGEKKQKKTVVTEVKTETNDEDE